MQPLIYPLLTPRPAKEDAALFTTDIVQINALVTPLFKQNRRGDILMAATTAESGAFEMIIAGRRVRKADRLVEALSDHLTEVRRASAARGRPSPAPDRSPMALSVQGAWRLVFRRDDTGWETRRYQFMVAQWTFVSSGGTVEVAGESPLAGGRHAA